MPEAANTGDPLPDDVSALLRAWTDGDQHALARLTPIVYDELHRLAHHYLRRERSGHSLQPTALVNEAYMRLVDHARRRNAKRGAKAPHVLLDAEAVLCADRSDDVEALDEALNALAVLAPRKARVVELRFFGGLSVEETADVLRVSPITVMREWKSAKAWLFRALTSPAADGHRPLESGR